MFYQILVVVTLQQLKTKTKKQLKTEARNLSGQTED